VIKNLQSLRQKDLLKYKDYGLGKDNLWALKSGAPLRLAEEVLNDNSEYDIKLTAPKSEIHTFKYEHEKACADVFVTLVLSGKLLNWEQHKKIGKSIIPDRTADTGKMAYIEVEMGSQNKIREKAEAYKQYFHETKQHFNVWFLVKEQRHYEAGLEILRNFPNAYSVELLDVFNSQIFSDMLSDTPSDGVLEEF
jgi:hypothetical protein